ncbi:MAG TPA: tRNA (adenosine(37)-N6)-threonylcarbamoyltransferase complex dimerization subunit type 1 TsaB [Polyangia bacterium]|jgi:tRNA threonylcarbamoyladenosine biosynthesis protein TsaB
MRALLAIETSTPVARVGVFDLDTGTPLAEASATSERHSSNLLRLCVEVTTQANVALSALAAIACGAGPGSFTGLRVGFAVAKGFALPFGIPLIVVSSLQVLARDMAAVAREGEGLLPCLDAGKGQVYAAPFALAGVERRGDDWVLTPDGVVEVAPREVPLLFAGTGAARYREALEAGLGARGRYVEVAGPSAGSLAAYAGERFHRGQFEDLNTVVPAYGRAPDITRPKRAQP